MPYIYTLGADTYFEDGTIMRGLVMDFSADRTRLGHRRTNICSARRSWSRRSPSTRRAAARSICPPAPAGTTSTPARASPAGRRSPPPRRTSACRCSFAPARSSRPDPRSSITGKNSHSPLTLERLHRRERQLLAVRGRRGQPAISQRQICAHPAQLERSDENADDRRARRVATREWPASARSTSAGCSPGTARA